ncbi:MAG: BamA/TamA family outer membrane protein [Balneolaceae bacterium]|nr:BamA/TamA family outer membrane protein [Balneolaceae bacterium]
MLPAISSSPETSLLFGGVGIRQFKWGNSKEDTRFSTVLLSAIYTLNNQVSVGVQPSLFSAHENWILEGIYSYSYFPESFWGIGRNTPDEDEMKVISSQIYLQQSVLRKVYGNLFLGPQFRWNSSYDIRFDDIEGQRVASPLITGAEGFKSFGLGAIARWDDRNRSASPTKGTLLQLSVMTHPYFLSTGKSYTSYIADGRKYVDLSNNGKSVLAFQGLTQLRTGRPPFTDLAMLGGESIMRGYYAGRYRDHNAAQIQTEFRQYLLGRIGFTVFAAAGQVWHSFDKMNLDRALLSGGGGLRFNLSRQDPINIRMDMAFGRKVSGFYVTLGEAF